MSEFLAWRQVICPFERDRKTLQYLISVTVFTEDGESSRDKEGKSKALCVSSTKEKNDDEALLLSLPRS